MTLDEAIRRNPYDPKRGNESAYCRYLRYNVEGWYQFDSKEVLRRWQKVRIGIMDDKSFNLNLEQGKAVAFDFDGVIHKYSEGWKDGSIYDEPNMEILNLILLLQLAKIPCVIISTREPNQIKEWWDKQGFTIMAKPLCFETKFFNDCTYVGITNRKIPAQLYIDDRAYRYTGESVKEFLINCSRILQPQVQVGK